jgi:hypothetical protein
LPFLGHFASDENRQKFSSTNAAALYGLEIVGLPDPKVGPAKTLNETIDPIGREPQ